VTIATSTPRTIDGQEIPAAGAYSLDVSHSSVGFSVRHLMVGKTRGRFAAFTGTVVVAEDPLASSVEVEIDAASIDTRDEQRDGHLRSPDFFDVEQFPKVTFTSTSVTHVDGDRWTVVGDLTVKDVTQSVTLDTTFEGASPKPEALGGGYSIGFSASAKLNREAFGLTWNAPLEGGGVLVGKDVTLEIETEAFEG